ncbi:P-type conjugative transfer protein VirB9 [soil metagenome]
MRVGPFLACFMLASAAGSSALAADTPVPGATDARIRTIFYDADQVVLLRGYFGYQMMIEFGPDERIENVSIGDALAWQVTPNRKATLLFIKPIERNVATNMTVVTDRRRYVFELSARPAEGARAQDMAYVVRFTYPPEPEPPRIEPPPPPPPSLPPERRNTAYSYTGSRAALPSLVFDDGQFTYFQWAAATSTPALFLLGPDGSESIVNYGVRDGFIVVEQVARRFLLRNGAEVTTVINEGWREPVPGALAPKPFDARTAREAAKAGVGL